MTTRVTLLLGALLTGLVAMGPISTDMYLPSLPILTATFDVAPERVQLTLSLFLAGFACAQLIYGPLSDRFGRRWVIFGGVGLYIVASAACAVAQTIDQLIVARFFQAVGACSGPVLARAVVRDLYGRARAAQMLAYMGTAMGLVPAAAPVLGGYLTVWFGWRSNFIALTAVGVVLILGVITVLRETNRHRNPTATDIARLVGNYAMLARSRAYLGYVLCAACAYSGLFAFISGSSFVLIDFLGVAVEDFGLYFMLIVVGYMAGALLVARLTPRFGLDPMLLAGATITATAGVLGAAVALSTEPSIATVVGPVVLYMVGLGIVMPNTMAGAIAPFPRMAGAASALLGFIQMALAAVSGMVAGAFHDGTEGPMVTTILIMGVGALVGYRMLAWPHRHDAAADP